MRIACLGWGSLIWDPRELEVKGEWDKSGPRLPIEFARILDDGRIGLVLAARASAVQVQWAEMNAEKLDEAVQNLADREGFITYREQPSDRVGLLLRNPDQTGTSEVRPSRKVDDVGAVEEEIRRWLGTTDMDAVIWTNSQPRKRSNKAPHEWVYVKPTEDEVIVHLRQLAGLQRYVALEYIRNIANRNCDVCIDRRWKKKSMAPEGLEVPLI